MDGDGSMTAGRYVYRCGARRVASARSGCQLAYRRQPLAKTLLHILTSLRTCTVVPHALATISGRTSCQRCRRSNAATDRRGSPSIAADAASPNKERGPWRDAAFSRERITNIRSPSGSGPHRPTVGPPRLIVLRRDESHTDPPAYADALMKMEKRLRQHQPSPASGD